jgi:hypothetical protein
MRTQRCLLASFLQNHHYGDVKTSIFDIIVPPPAAARPSIPSDNSWQNGAAINLCHVSTAYEHGLF